MNGEIRQRLQGACQMTLHHKTGSVAGGGSTVTSPKLLVEQKRGQGQY